MGRIDTSPRRRRGRSPAPISVTSRAKAAATSGAVNELDRISLGQKTGSTEAKEKTFQTRERITCTFETKSGGRDVPVRRVVAAGERDRLSAGRLSWPQGRAPFANARFERSLHQNYAGIPVRGRGARQERELEEETDKPVLKLHDPAAVPKGRSYFDHDDREKDVWRGKAMYDPRKDFGFGPDKWAERDHRGGGSAWRGFGRPAERRPFDSSRGGFGKSRYSSSSGADGVWTHDKFFEIEGGGEEEKNGADNENEKDNDISNTDTRDKNDLIANHGRKSHKQRSRSRSVSPSCGEKEKRRFREEEDNEKEVSTENEREKRRDSGSGRERDKGQDREKERAKERARDREDRARRHRRSTSRSDGRSRRRRS